MAKNKLPIAQLILILIVLFSLSSVLGIIVYSLALKKTPQLTVSQPTAEPIPTQGPDNILENNEWKVYKNDKYKFEFEYPLIYLYDENLLGGTEYSINFGPKFEDDNSQRKAGGNFELTIDKNENGLDNFIREADEARGQIEQSSEFIEMEKIAGLSAKIVKACDQGSNCNKIIYFTDGKYIYSIYLEKYFNTNASSKKILDRMLASFQFETNTAADWKTYKNNDFGIELEYPPELFVTEENQKITVDSLKSDDPKQHSSIGIISKMSISLDRRNMQEIINEYENNNLKNFSKEQISINGLKAIRIIYTGAYGGETNYITLIRDEKRSETLIVYYVDNAVYQKIFEQILFTLKFT